MTMRVGDWYEVPTIQVNIPIPLPDGTSLTLTWFGYTGPLAVLTPWSKDEEFLNPGFPVHLHIDWRFVDPETMHRILMYAHSHVALLFVMTVPELRFMEYLQPKLRYMKMQQKALPLPHYGEADWMPQLEREFACAALVNGKCPHRGTPQSAMIRRKNGMLVCPAHGLRWSEETGQLMPRKFKAPTPSRG